MGNGHKRNHILKEYNIGDIVWVDFPYQEDGIRYKFRPALIYYKSAKSVNLLLLKITTAEREEEKAPYDYRVKYLKSAGLDLNKTSYIRCNHVYCASENEPALKSGRLAKSEGGNVATLYKRAYKRGHIERYEKKRK